MIKYITMGLCSCFLLSAQLQAGDSFWEDEEVENATTKRAANTMKAAVAPTPANVQTIATHIDPSRQPTLATPPVQRQAPKPKPKPLLLPYDPRIQLRPAGNNPTINKNLRVSLASNYMKEVDRWYRAGGDINSQDPQGNTLLNSAIRRHHTKGIEFLLLRRADVKKPSQNGETPLTIAVETGQARVVKMLLERNASISPMKNGDTMIHYALTRGHAQIAMDLLEKGVDVNRNYSAGKSLLHVAAARNLFNPAQALLNSGANVNTQDNEGATPLHEASAKGYKRMVNLLISRNANIKMKTKKKWSPIHHAARFGHTEVVRLLLSRGASTNNRNSEGKTPLALAKHLNHQPVVDLLASRTRGGDGTSSGSTRRGWFW